MSTKSTTASAPSPTVSAEMRSIEERLGLDVGFFSRSDAAANACLQAAGKDDFVELQKLGTRYAKISSPAVMAAAKQLESGGAKYGAEKSMERRRKALNRKAKGFGINVELPIDATRIEMDAFDDMINGEGRFVALTNPEWKPASE